MRAHRLAVLVLAVAGCGDDAATANVDAAVDLDSSTDGDGGIDASGMVTCDFTEAADATNSTTTNAELTTLTLGTRITLCGEIDNGHFDSVNDVVDADAFKFTVAADTDVIVHIAGAGIDMPADTVLQLRSGDAFVGFGIVEGDHGTLSARLPVGEYSAAMASFNASDLTAPIAYQITIRPDTPATRCPTATAGAVYAESMDGGSNNGNDVITYTFTANNPSALTAANDSPETSGHTIAPATSYRVTGSSAAVDPADDYMDRDTFAFTTGATTTQMSIRLNWPATTVDFDYRVYSVTTTGFPLSIVGGLDDVLVEDEFETFAVKPSTTYWLWIAAEDGAIGQPATYAATLCGESFAP